MRTIRDFAELDASVDGAEEALRLATSEGDDVEEAFAHWVLARQYRGQRRFAESYSHLDAALARARKVGECYLEALILASAGRARQHAGDLEAACPPYEEALALQRQTGQNEVMARSGRHRSRRRPSTELRPTRRGARTARRRASRPAATQAMAPCELFALAHLALLSVAERSEDARATLLRVAQRGSRAPDVNVQALADAAAVLAGALEGPDGDCAFDGAQAKAHAGSDSGPRR